jgi:hypothetical protein
VLGPKFGLADFVVEERDVFPFCESTHDLCEA